MTRSTRLTATWKATIAYRRLQRGSANARSGFAPTSPRGDPHRMPVHADSRPAASPGCHRHAHRRCDHASVQRQVERHRNQQGHANRADGLEETPGEGDASRPAQRRQQGALDQHLTQQPSPARSQRETQTQLSSSGRRARQQEPGHVRARDQHHESEQQEHACRARPQAFFEQRVGGHVARPEHGRAQPGVRSRVDRVERLHHVVQLEGGAGDRLPFAKPSLEQHPAQAATLEPRGSGRRRAALHHHGLDIVDPGDRHPEGRGQDWRRHAGEGLGGYPHDGVRTTSDAQGAADDVRVAIVRRGPERRRDHHDRRRARTVVVRQQHPAARGRDAEQLEVVAGGRFAGTGP